jgi:benzodiazapine receptor
MIIAFGFTLWRNAASSMGDVSVGSVSDKYPTLITPSGSAFSIWGLIYIMLLLFVLRENIRPSSTLRPDTARNLYILFDVTCVVNIIWIELFVREYVGSCFIPIFILWLFLLTIYGVLFRTVEPKVSISATVLPPIPTMSYACTSWLDYLSLRIPFTLYFSWITGAMLINFCLALEGLGATLTTSIYMGCLVFLILCHLIALLCAADWVYMLVGVWTLVWIAVKRNKEAATISDFTLYGDVIAVETMATISVAIVSVLFMLLVLVKLLGHIWGEMAHTSATTVAQNEAQDEMRVPLAPC